LAKQLGLTGKDAEKFSKKVGETGTTLGSLKQVVLLAESLVQLKKD
jgi:hypothetical protein